MDGNDEFLEVSDELQLDEISTTTGSTIDLQGLQVLNQNLCISGLFITGTIGILCGLVLGGAFRGIFRSR